VTDGIPYGTVKKPQGDISCDHSLKNQSVWLRGDEKIKECLLGDEFIFTFTNFGQVLIF